MTVTRMSMLTKVLEWKKHWWSALQMSPSLEAWEASASIPIVCVCSVMSRSLQPDEPKPARLLCPWDFSSKNTGVGCHSFHRGIFPTQGLNPGLLHCRRIFYLLSHKGSPRILEWVAYPFSSRSSQPRNQPGVSCIADGFFTNWAMREAPQNIYFHYIHVILWGALYGFERNLSIGVTQVMLYLSRERCF